MILTTFVEQVKHTKTLTLARVFCFSAATSPYPLLFFHHLFAFFKRNQLPITRINIEHGDVGAIKALLSTMSFMGEMVYWLEGFSELSDKKQQELLVYLRVYHGPHRVLFFSDKMTEAMSQSAENDGMQFVELPRDIMMHDFLAVRSLVSDQLQSKSSFASQLTMYSDYLSLDNVCLLAHYELVLGKSADDFFAQWITRIIDPTSSLFVLSQHFFGKKLKPFFRQWATMSESYATTFWPTFWADQLWRAYIYCDLMKQQKYAEAKKVQYKLPFSFINRDWQRYSLNELRAAHDFLTDLDFRLKNGGSEIGLEHFYGQFFDNKLR